MRLSNQSFTFGFYWEAGESPLIEHSQRMGRRHAAERYGVQNETWNETVHMCEMRVMYSCDCQRDASAFSIVSIGPVPHAWPLRARRYAFAPVASRAPRAVGLTRGLCERAGLSTRVLLGPPPPLSSASVCLTGVRCQGRPGWDHPRRAAQCVCVGGLSQKSLLHLLMGYARQRRLQVPAR